MGRSYFASGEEEKAASEYEAAAKLDPQDGEAYFALGQMRMFQRRTAQAEEALRHAIQVSPNLGPAYAALAQILMGEGKNAEARGLLEKAVTLNSQDWQSQYELAVLLNQAGETARATELLEKVLQVNPDFPGAREQLATGLLRRGDIQGATTLAGKMIAEDPQGPEGHRIMALALWKQRDYDGSLAECAMALNADQNSSADAGASVHRALAGRTARRMRRRPSVMRPRSSPKWGRQMSSAACCSATRTISPSSVNSSTRTAGCWRPKRSLKPDFSPHLDFPRGLPEGRDEQRGEPRLRRG